MTGFAANSLLCRQALRQTGIDEASFTLVRIVSGAIVLALIVRLRRGRFAIGGNWGSATALFAYAACFSFAYRDLTAATGALLLFFAVQSTMIGCGLFAGERILLPQLAGLVLAAGGLLGLLLPGLTAPPLRAALLMLTAGVSWGVYSLRGRGAGDPTQVTAGNFLRAALLAAALSLGRVQLVAVDAQGVIYAVGSGAVASGLGYAIWYAALRGLKATEAATVQLSVPVLAAIGGVLWLHEPPTWRLVLASGAILGGVAVVILAAQLRAGARR
jgi:drug/metabolite transporter (DMT)-like permease